MLPPKSAPDVRQTGCETPYITWQDLFICSLFNDAVSVAQTI
jgi:hypothetical protein